MWRVSDFQDNRSLCEFGVLLERREQMYNSKRTDVCFLYKVYTQTKTSMSPKKGPFQKERTVFQLRFFRGHSLVFE